MPQVVTLEQLRDFAAAEENRDRLFSLSDSTHCLAAQCHGRPMFGYDTFCDEHCFTNAPNIVPEAFSRFLREYDRSPERVENEQDLGVFSGLLLGKAMAELIHGDNPVTVVERLLRRRAKEKESADHSASNGQSQVATAIG